MNERPILRSAILLFALILSACGSPSTAAVSDSSGATEPPAAESASSESAGAESQSSESAAAPAESAPAVQHTDVPAEPPTSGGVKLGDHSTITTTPPGRALTGDKLASGKFERPWNANTQDVYFPQLDIVSATVFADDATWVYTTLTMVGRDSGDAFTGQYAIELDLDQYGDGEFLVLVSQPASAEWTTQGVSVFQDVNSDVGGERPVLEDSAGAGGDGFEVMLFDQGGGDDPDLAWVRLDPNDPNSIQIAFKQSLLGGEKTYTAGMWAATSLNPALFDYNDHFTLEQAGAANPEVEAFYPIKGLSEMDNTCHAGIGFTPSGSEPAICS